MPPGKPIKRYTGAADGRTIGHVLNELIVEVNYMAKVLQSTAELAIVHSNLTLTDEALNQIREQIKENEGNSSGSL